MEINVRLERLVSVEGKPVIAAMLLGYASVLIADRQWWP